MPRHAEPVISLEGINDPVAYSRCSAQHRLCRESERVPVIEKINPEVHVRYKDSLAKIVMEPWLRRIEETLLVGFDDRSDKNL